MCRVAPFHFAYRRRLDYPDGVPFPARLSFVVRLSKGGNSICLQQGLEAVAHDQRETQRTMNFFVRRRNFPIFGCWYVLVTATVTVFIILSETTCRRRRGRNQHQQAKSYNERELEIYDHADESERSSDDSGQLSETRLAHKLSEHHFQQTGLCRPPQDSERYVSVVR